MTLTAVTWMSAAGAVVALLLLAIFLRVLYRFATGAPIRHDFTHRLCEKQLLAILSAIDATDARKILLRHKSKER